MLEKLGSGLRDALKKLAGKSYIDDKIVDELTADIRRSLLAGDVDVKLANELVERIRDRIRNEKPASGSTAREHAIKIVYEELVKFVGHKTSVPIKPTRILLAGLFGSGKTTTAGKLAYFYQKKGLRPALVACDVFRPAAYEQLEQLSKQLKVGFYGERSNEDAAQIAANALKKVKADVYIFDSSGRDALDDSMISEIKMIGVSAAPQEKILVLPADIGQAAREQAEAFHKALGITGIIITKLDGTAKAGGALTACAVTKAPVKWIGVGEKMDAMEQFDPERFVSRLVGWGDIQTLMEKAKEVIEPKKAKETAERMMSGKFTMADFYEQLKAMQGMGSLKQVMDMVPGGAGMKLPGGMDMESQEKKMKKWKYIIESMTVKERNNPDVIDASRVKRIAKGSGTSEAEVRELMKNYNQSKKMMKMMGSGRGSMMQRLAKKFKLG